MKIEEKMSVDLEVDLSDVPLAPLAIPVAQSRNFDHWQQFHEPILALHWHKSIIISCCFL